MSNDSVPVSQLLVSWVESIPAEVTFYDILNLLSERGFALLMLLFALPLSIPLPVPPGFTTVLSIPLLLLSTQIVFGWSRPWVPAWVGNRKFKREGLVKMFKGAIPVLSKLERFIKPRLLIMSGYLGEKVYGFFSLLCAISIAIPLPLTNFIPAMGIAIMSLGFLNKDGLAVLAGLLVGTVGLIVSTLVIVLGPKVVMGLLSFLGLTE